VSWERVTWEPAISRRRQSDDLFPEEGVDVKRPCARVLAAGAAVLLLLAQPASGGAPRADEQFKRVLENLQQARIDLALAEADRLIARYPNFRLAHLVRGDLLSARAGPIAGLGNTGHAGRERLEELRAEAQARSGAYKGRPAEGFLPRYLLQFDPRQTHAIVVDAGHWRVYVYENSAGMPRLVEDYYVTVGKRGIEKEREGDKKTPVGVYHVVSRIPGSKLPDLYGWGAFPIDYPNEWDRARGRTGYGIWLHGVPSDTYARAPQASDGCIAFANPDIAALAGRVQVGATPVIIAERVEWVAPEALLAERDAFAQRLEKWLGDWQSLDSDRYLEHYARGFRSNGMDLAAWRTHKRRVIKATSSIKVSLANVSVFRNPGIREGVVTVTFDQDYRSSSLIQRTRKRQYWVEEDGRWKIAYEAPMRSSGVTLPESFRKAAR
jgi:murein L,D-transpeptidase YafK